MNERIKELMEQAKEYAWSRRNEELRTVSLDNIFNEKFAELIVRECAHLVGGYTIDGIDAKIKSPYYLTSKWFARNPKTDKLMSGNFKKQIDEEYYPLIDHIQANIEEFTLLDEQARLKWVSSFLET